MDEDEFDDVLEDEEEDIVEELDSSDPQQAFLIVERNFNKTINDLEQNSELANYVEAFAKLFEAYYNSHMREQQLQDQYDELVQKTIKDEEYLHVVRQLAKTDTKTIEDLKTEIQKAWKMADNAHAREQTAQELIENLRKQIDSLNAEIEFKNKMGQDTEELEQSKHADALQRERDKLLSEITKITEKLNNALIYQEELERRTSVTDLKMAEIGEQLEGQILETEKYKKVKEKLDLEVRNLVETVDKKDDEIGAINETLVNTQKTVFKLEQNIKEQKNVIDKAVKETETVTNKFNKMQDDLDILHFNQEVLKKEIGQKATNLRLKEEEAIKLKNDVSKLAKSKEIAENRIHFLETERAEVSMDRDKIKQAMITINRDLDDMKKQNDMDKRTLDQIGREKDILNKTLTREQALTRDHVKVIKMQEQSRRKLMAEIDNHVMEGTKKMKQISYLEKERDRFLEEQLHLSKTIEDLTDEAKLRKAEIYDLKKIIDERDNKIRMQLNLFDSVRAERNALQKSLLESNAESAELKTKLKLSSHQTEQLKEDIAMKEQAFIKEEIILRKVTKEKENLRVEVDNNIETIRKLKQELAEMKAEERRLHKVILNSDKLIRQQRKDLEQLMNERDILGSQLVRRNDELGLLYEKIKILQTTLHRGEAQYDQRIEDIRLLKIEIKRLRQEKSLLTKSISNMTDLKQEVFLLERDLTRERLKCKALEEELQNPLNMHRWRKLEGSDPDTFELLKRVQILQKRLLRQSAQAVSRERQLKEAEVLYLNLRQVVSKQPGPEVHEQLGKTQRALTNNINKMKCLVSELNMTELQAKEYKTNLEKVNDELKELKRKYINLKKAHEKQSQMVKQMSSQALNQSQSREIKISGGGYRMSVTGVNNKDC